MGTRKVEIIGTTPQRKRRVDAQDGEIWQDANGTEWHLIHGDMVDKHDCGPGDLRGDSVKRNKWLVSHGAIRVYPLPEPAIPTPDALHQGDIVGYGRSDVLVVAFTTNDGAGAVSLIGGNDVPLNKHGYNWHLIAKAGTGRIVIHADGTRRGPTGDTFGIIARARQLADHVAHVEVHNGREYANARDAALLESDSGEWMNDNKGMRMIDGGEGDAIDSDKEREAHRVAQRSGTAPPPDGGGWHYGDEGTDALYDGEMALICVRNAWPDGSLHDYARDAVWCRALAPPRWIGRDDNDNDDPSGVYAWRKMPEPAPWRGDDTHAANPVPRSNTDEKSI